MSIHSIINMNASMGAKWYWAYQRSQHKSHSGWENGFWGNRQRLIELVHGLRAKGGEQ